MRIISKFKDFYDHISYVYGVDNTVVYNRLVFDEVNVDKEYYWKRIQEIPKVWHSQDLGEEARGHSRRLKWLCYCGKYILLVQEDDYFVEKYNIFNEQDHPELYRYFFRRDKCYRFKDDFKEEDIISSKPDPYLIELSKELKQPVFIIEQANRGHLSVNYKVPNLAEIPLFTKNFTADQTWKEVNDFICNELRENPDTKPPVEISNIDKIHKAGFDVKTSFRGNNK